MELCFHQFYRAAVVVEAVVMEEKLQNRINYAWRKFFLVKSALQIELSYSSDYARQSARQKLIFVIVSIRERLEQLLQLAAEAAETTTTAARK